MTTHASELKRAFALYQASVNQMNAFIGDEGTISQEIGKLGPKRTEFEKATPSESAEYTALKTTFIATVITGYETYRGIPESVGKANSAAEAAIKALHEVQRFCQAEAAPSAEARRYLVKTGKYTELDADIKASEDAIAGADFAGKEKTLRDKMKEVEAQKTKLTGLMDALCYLKKKAEGNANLLDYAPQLYGYRYLIEEEPLREKREKAKEMAEVTPAAAAPAAAEPAAVQAPAAKASPPPKTTSPSLAKSFLAAAKGGTQAQPT
jgi:hypothetical protein